MFAHTFEHNEWSNFYLIWFDYVTNFFKSFETRPRPLCFVQNFMETSRKSSAIDTNALYSGK